jgi:TonB family protein
MFDSTTHRQAVVATHGACAAFTLWMAAMLLAPPIVPDTKPRGGNAVTLARPPQPLLLPPRGTGGFDTCQLIQRGKPEHLAGTRMRGTVRLSAIVGSDGHIKQLRVVSGHPLLIDSALSAVRQWTFEPMFLDGDPVEVESCFDVVFHPK